VDESPSPSESPSPQPSRKPAPKPSLKSAAAVVKDTRYYIRHLPKFDAPPAPEPVDVEAGTSSPVWFKVPTTQKVAFLTIDDGALQHPMALPLLKASGVRVTLFLTLNYAKKNPAYFKALQDAGAVIENHTIDHTSLKGQSYDFQKHEICYTADQFGSMFGRRPTLFRPPYGDYDATTLQVARECGQKVVFYWTETVDKGIVRYQSSNHTIQPGHIVLMHFRPAYGDDFTSALNHMKASGVTPALLEDYVKGACENSCRP
jgi:peptidoglycan/xylan/chitin deacetylase (PgdA/CDA1 family)